MVMLLSKIHGGKMHHKYYNNPAEYIKNIKTVLRGLWDVKGRVARENSTAMTSYFLI
jgi:hypothetical protein